MTAHRAAVGALVGVLLLAAGGCQGSGEDPAPAGVDQPHVSSPLAACDQLASPPVRAGSGAAAGDTGADPLPELVLACLTGGEPFPLADLRGPAVVNLWASWCPPCREELPALQRYADQRAGRVHVLGVVTADRPERAAALATDLGIRFPGLADPDGRVRAALGEFLLPLTLLVDAAGRVRYVHRTGALDQPELARLVRDHLGVAS
jgi:thiol-disulfide isomerase/thioredoxin